MPLTTTLSFVNGLCVISALLLLSFALYKDDWAQFGTCTVHLRQETRCKTFSEQIRLAAYICQLVSGLLSVLSTVVGILLLFLTNCCDQRYTSHRRLYCLCLIPVSNAFGSIVCLCGSVFLLKMNWGADKLGVSFYSSLSAGGLLLGSSIIVLCIFFGTTDGRHSEQYEVIRGEDVETNVDHNQNIHHRESNK